MSATPGAPGASDMSGAVDELESALLSLYRELEARPDVRPGPAVDGLFGRLVRLVLSAPEELAAELLGRPAVAALLPRLRRICAHGEYELELAWAQRVAASRRPERELARFPYLDNYRRLCRMELAALSPFTTRPVRSVVVAGSGPLPLSSWFVARELGVPVDNIDRDAEAIAAAHGWSHALEPGTLRFLHRDVRSADLSGVDVVFLAALVGETGPEKAAVIRQLAHAMDPGALLLVRSVRGIRTLLYPEVDMRLLDGFDVLDVVHPVDDVINSAVVARVRGASAVPAPRPGSEV